MIKENEKKGMVLVSILFVTIIMLILTTSLLTLHHNNLRFTSIMENQVAARKVAEAGVAYALYALENDPDWEAGPSNKIVYNMPEVNGRFEISFDSSAGGYYSVNNLLNGQDPNGAFDGGSVPAFSVDLIVAGIIEKGNTDVVKRLRVIVQGDPFFDGALTSGRINVNAKSLEVSRADASGNDDQPGTIHSNSVIVDPNGYAIDVEELNLINGGKASAQGDINVSVLTDGTLEANTQGRHIKPLDIIETISQASSTISPTQKYSGMVYVVGKDKLYNSAGNEIAIPDGVEISNGQFIIKDDILFEGGDVRFEFDYASITDGLDPAGTEIDLIIQESGIILDPNASTPPSVYVESGDLTVAGPIKGNGSFYVSGDADYIGESNIVAPSDPGVAVMCEGDLTMQLPCLSGEPASPQTLELDMTGLVYSHGNANISILDPADSTNPANNFSGGQWPTDWVNQHFGNGDGFEEFIFPIMYFDASAGAMVEVDGYLCVEGGVINIYGEYEDGMYKHIFRPDASGDGKITISYDLNDGSGPVVAEVSNELIIEQFGVNDGAITIDGSSFSVPAPVAYGFGNSVYAIYDPSYTYNGLEFPYDPYGSPTNIDPNDPSVVTFSPKFNIKGGLIAIDPNNPVPTEANPDGPDAGNMLVDIGDGDVKIVSSPQYLKLLHISDGAFEYKCVSWSEL